MKNINGTDALVYTAIFSYAAGILSYSFFSFSLFFILTVIVSTVLLIVLAKAFSVKKYWLYALLVFSAAFSVGMGRINIWQETYGNAPLHSFVSTEHTWEGVVVKEADKRDFNTRLTVLLPKFQTRVLLTVPHYPEYVYGEKVQFTGKLKLPANFKSQLGREFKYVNFLKKDNIHYTVNFAHVTSLGLGHGNFITGSLLNFKSSFINRLNLLLSEPHSSFLGGLILGAKSSMGQSLLDDFRTTGVIHIVVLSGFNVTVVAIAIMWLLSFLGVRMSTAFGVIAIGAFTLMTGAGATVVRASIMAVIFIVARVTGNVSGMNKALFVAGFFMLLHNPMLLLHDPSFQLSFMATLGLIHITPLIEPYLRFVPKLFELRGLVAVTLATQVAVTPMLLYMTGVLPTYSVFANMLILVAVPFTMYLGFAAGFISYFSVVLAFPFTLVTYVLLEYDLQVVYFFANLPYASFSLSTFNFTHVIISYLFITVLVVYYKRKNEPI